MLVPIIGTFADLSLTPSLKQEAFQITSAALSIVDERDFPVVARALLGVLESGSLFRAGATDLHKRMHRK
jgi:hypothetical protein